MTTPLNPNPNPRPQPTRGPLKITPAAEFGTVPVQLPHGPVVKMGWLSLHTLIAGGIIPNPLLSTAIKVAGGDSTPPELKPDAATRDPDVVAQESRLHYQLFDLVVIACVTQPRFVLTQAEVDAYEGDGGEGEPPVWIGRLHDEDKYLIYRVSQEATLDGLNSFRYGTTGTDAGPDGAEVRQTPLGDTGPA